MLIFLENDLKFDASGLTIGTGSTSKLSAYLTLNQTSTIPATFTVTTSGSPFTPTLTKITDQNYRLDITFDQPLANVIFNTNHVLHIVANTTDTADINVEINYANNFSSANWTNSADAISIDDVDYKGPLTSVSLNNRLRSILTNAIDALNQARLNAKFYFFKEKYLSDIIEFAMAGSTLEDSGTEIFYNADGSVDYIYKTYGSTRLRSQKIEIVYNYANFNVTRIQKRGVIETTLETTVTSLVDSFDINAYDNADNFIYKIGHVKIDRTVTPTLYSVPYLKDYVDNGLPLTDPYLPDNIMADYKYYKTNTITGWTVTV